MVNAKLQAITIKIPLEDYGWLQRYAEKNDTTLSQLVRKAIRMYIIALTSKKKKEEGSNNGGSIS